MTHATTPPDPLDEAAVERLLGDHSFPGDLGPDHVELMATLQALRARASARELAREDETVGAMVATLRFASPPEVVLRPHSAATSPRRITMLAAAAAGLLVASTSGLAAAGGLPDPVQSAAAEVLSAVGISVPNPDQPEDSSGLQDGSPPVATAPVESTAPESTVPVGSTPPDTTPPPSSPRDRQTSESGTNVPNRGPSSTTHGPPPGKGASFAPSVTLSGMNLVVAFEEAGVSSSQVVIVARADVTASYGCVRGKGERATAGHAITAESIVQGEASFLVIGGTAAGTLTLLPPSPGIASCPAGQTPTLVGTRYSNVTITDTTNGKSVAIPRTFTANY